MSRRIFVDMDGVLAKWEEASLEEMTSPGFSLSNGTWRGYSIHNNMEPEKMFLQLDAISLMEATRIEHMERENAIRRGNLRR